MLRLKIVILLTLLVAFGTFGFAHAQKPVVHAVLFYASTCPHCQYVLQNTLPPLQEQYGDSLQISMYEVRDPAYYELWIEAIDAFQISYDDAGVPMMFIGDEVLIGSEDIPARLPDMIEKYLAQGGVDNSKIPGIAGQDSSLTTPTPLATEPAPAPVPTP